jgi:hypothetical protein
MELCSGHLGNGLTIWEKGTNNIIAHIDKYRHITYRISKKELSKKNIKEIENTAKTDNRTISVTQDQKVFIN